MAEAIKVGLIVNYGVVNHGAERAIWKHARELLGESSLVAATSISPLLAEGVEKSVQTEFHTVLAVHRFATRA